HNRVLVLGSGPRAAEVTRLIQMQAFGEYQVAGSLDPKIDLAAPAADAAAEVLRAVGGVEPASPPQIVGLEQDAPAGEVALAPAPTVVPAAQLIVAPAGPSVEASVAALPTQPRTEPLEQGPLASVVQLLSAAPLLILLAVLIKLDSPGPVFYSQERTGRGGKPYRVQKLRTMRKDAETLSGPVWAAQRDPRATRIGTFLRKTRLDEIPQVFAVFRGDMSFVGPRPERPFFVQQLKQPIPFFGLREAVKPGITGWAQIRYPYGSSLEDAKAKLEYDLYYVEHRSLFLDLAICFHTAKTVLFGRGAR